MQITGWRFVTYDNLAGRPARQEEVESREC